MEDRLIAIVAAALRVPTSALTLETGPGDLEAWGLARPAQRRLGDRGGIWRFDPD